MKTIEIKSDLKVIKSNSFFLEEDTTIIVQLGIEGFEKEAFVCKGQPVNVVIMFDGTLKDWKRVKKGTDETWIEYSDYSPSYGSGVYSQRYASYYSFLKNVIFPVVVHCIDGDSKLEKIGDYNAYTVWR